MLKRIYKRLEIIGYARAIGALSHYPQVPASTVQSLIEEQAKARAELSAMKSARKSDPQKTYMRGTQNA